jgi:asparagine synthetase B (glutamine-hydrolysing)
MEIFQKYSLFTLFHHDIYYQNQTFDFDTKKLFQLSKKQSKYEIKDIAETIYAIVTENIENLNDSDISLTLTGGMDSRLILAALLKAGVKPNCFTFGNPESKDVVFAKEISEKLGLAFHNAVSC